MHTTTNPYTQLKTQIRHLEVLQTYLQATKYTTPHYAQTN